MSTITSEALSYLEQSSIALLITVGPENKPQVRYICPLINKGFDIYFTTSLESRKVEHIAINPVVTLYFQNPNQNPKEFQSVAITGKATRVQEGNEFSEVLNGFIQKSAAFKDYIGKTHTIYKINTTFLQYTDFSKSKKTFDENI